MTKTLGLAIPTYERPAMTFETFAAIYDDPRVEEIAIVDDGSTSSTFHEMADRALHCAKIRLKAGSYNLGCYLNKYRAMLFATMPWIALVDSDNVFDARYLDALAAMHWERDVLYLPVLVQETLDYRPFAGLSFARDTIVQYLDDLTFRMALNTGNFFVHRDTYLSVFDMSAQPSAADSLYFVYCWLSTGRSAQLVPGLTYQHRVHDGYWRQHATESILFADVLVARMRADHWGPSCIA